MNALDRLTVGEVLGILATLGLIIALVRSVHPVMKRLNNLLDDWNGASARPGVPERPGVMERLSRQDEALEAVRSSIEPLVGDNHLESNHAAVLQRLDMIAGRHTNTVARLTVVEGLLRRHIRESQHWITQVDQATAARDFKMPPWPSLPDDDDVT